MMLTALEKITQSFRVVTDAILTLIIKLHPPKFIIKNLLAASGLFVMIEFVEDELSGIAGFAHKRHQQARFFLHRRQP